MSNINFHQCLANGAAKPGGRLQLDAETLGATSTPTPTAPGTTSTPTNTPTITSTATPPVPGSFTIGETNILGIDDFGNGNILIAQQVNLSQTATIQSLSFYITSAVGRLRLGIYDHVAGVPGTLKAQTAEFSPTIGWNTQNVLTPTQLTAGTYWLAYLPESNDLHFRVAFSGPASYYNYPFGAMPDTFSSSPQVGTFPFFVLRDFTGRRISHQYTYADTDQHIYPDGNQHTRPDSDQYARSNSDQHASPNGDQYACPTATNTPAPTATNTPAPTATYTPATATRRTRYTARSTANLTPLGPQRQPTLLLQQRPTHPPQR